jgi:hypothetical protein
MNLFSENDIEYSSTVTVQRPQTNFSSSGNYEESFETVIEGMTADIQLSLKVRKVVSEDEKGIADNTEWRMFCNPPEPILSGDRISDGARIFFIDAVGDWGSHTECVMRLYSDS